MQQALLCTAYVCVSACSTLGPLYTTSIPTAHGSSPTAYVTGRTRGGHNQWEVGVTGHKIAREVKRRFANGKEPPERHKGSRPVGLPPPSFDRGDLISKHQFSNLPAHVRVRLSRGISPPPPTARRLTPLGRSPQTIDGGLSQSQQQPSLLCCTHVHSQLSPICVCVCLRVCVCVCVCLRARPRWPGGRRGQPAAAARPVAAAAHVPLAPPPSSSSLLSI